MNALKKEIERGETEGKKKMNRMKKEKGWQKNMAQRAGNEECMYI